MSVEDSNFVHQKPDGSWWFWDETEYEEIGPYSTQAKAVGALVRYADELNKGDAECCTVLRNGSNDDNTKCT